MNIEKRVALLENRSHVNFAAVSNKAMGLEDGNVKIELSPAHNAIYFASARKSLSECIHFDVFDSKIRDVQGIVFNDGREITGVVDSYTEDPTKVLSAVAIDEFAAHVGELESKVDEAEEKITDNTNKITEHDVSITNNTDKIAEHEKRINQNAADIIDCITDIGNNRNRIDGVINKVEDHETRITENTNKIADHEERIESNRINIWGTMDDLTRTMVNVAENTEKITKNTENITHLEETKAEKTEVLPFDFIYPVGSIVTGTRPRIGTWTQICTYGSWFFESYYHYIYVVKTMASIEVSIYFRVPENLVYVLNFKKLTAKCKNPTMNMFDFRFDRITEDTMYGHIEEYPRIWRDSYSFAGSTVTMTSKIDLNYGYNNKQPVTLHFRFMRYQLQDYDSITASTFRNYVYFDTYGYDKTTADDSIYAYKRTA